MDQCWEPKVWGFGKLAVKVYKWGASIEALLPGGHMMLVITIIDIIFDFVFDSQFNDFVFPIFTVTENNNENDNSV